MTIRRWAGALAAVAFSLGFEVAAQAGATLDKVKQAGQISCGVPTGIAGFAAPDGQGHWTGFDDERGLNNLWTKGGLLYAMPIR